MPLHKKIKLSVEIEIPESRADFDPSQWLHAGTHVRILHMETLEVSDVPIAATVNERQRAFNEYKRVLKVAADKTQFAKIIKFKNRGTRTIDICVPGGWGGNRPTPAIVLACENTTIVNDEWIVNSFGKSERITTKFELGKPTIIDEIAAFIEQRLLEYKKQNAGRLTW